MATRWLSRCSRYVAVEPVAARGAAAWLARAQLAAGGWPAPPPAQRTAPHAQAPQALAAHALVALHHTKVHGTELTDCNVRN